MATHSLTEKLSSTFNGEKAAKDPLSQTDVHSAICKFLIFNLPMALFMIAAAPLYNCYCYLFHVTGTCNPEAHIFVCHQ